jgi:hypothetical protein
MRSRSSNLSARTADRTSAGIFESSAVDFSRNVPPCDTNAPALGLVSSLSISLVLGKNLLTGVYSAAERAVHRLSRHRRKRLAFWTFVS